MNDVELDRLVAMTSPATDGRIAALDLRQAKDELKEEIMASDITDVALAESRPTRFPRRGYRVAIGLVAAAAAIVAAVLVVSGGGHDPEAGSSDVQTQPPAELPRLLADVVPDGYELSSTYDQPSEEDTQAQAALDELDDLRRWPVRIEEAIYGDPDAEDPFEVSGLEVTVTQPGDLGSPAPVDSAEPVTVRGHQGYACGASTCGGNNAGRTSLSWDEAPGLNISLAAIDIDLQQLTAIAEGLEIQGDHVTLGPLPSGLRGPLDELSRIGSEPPESRRPSHSAIYLPAGADDPALSISATEGDDHYLLARLFDSQTRERVEVRGHHGWSTTSLTVDGAPAYHQLIWQEAPGVIVAVDGVTDVSEAELLATAESLREATDEEWEAARPHEPADAAVVESYIPEDAVAFVTTDELGGAAYLTADGQVCGFVVDDEGKTSDTCGSAEQRVHELRDRSGEVKFLFGAMPDGAADVSATNLAVSEDAMSAFHDVPPEDGPRLYVLPLDIMVPDTITFRDSQGQPVETVSYP